MKNMRKNGSFAGKTALFYTFQETREGLYCLPCTPSTPLHAHTHTHVTFEHSPSTRQRQQRVRRRAGRPPTRQQQEGEEVGACATWCNGRFLLFHHPPRPPETRFLSSTLMAGGMELGVQDICACNKYVERKEAGKGGVNVRLSLACHLVCMREVLLLPCPHPQPRKEKEVAPEGQQTATTTTRTT